MHIQQLTLDDQDPKIVEKIITKIVDLMIQDEDIRYIAVQKKPAVNLLPTCIVATNKRLFYCEPANLGLTTDFTDIYWKNIKSLSFKEELFGAKLICVPNHGENIATDYIPKTQARKIAQIASEELLNLEKENLAAAATPAVEMELKTVIPMMETPISPAAPAPEEEDDMTKRLQKLKILFDKQLISQEEYEHKKALILNDL